MNPESCSCTACQTSTLPPLEITITEAVSYRPCETGTYLAVCLTASILTTSYNTLRIHPIPNTGGRLK
jgi:hypothetical protein